MKKWLTITIFMAFLFMPYGQSFATPITDGDFGTWTFNAVNTATMSREPSGGNPGARLNNTTISGPGSFGTGIKGDYSTSDPLTGAFSLSLDVLSGPGAFGAGQAILLLVEQNGNIYSNSLGVTGFPRNWDTLTFNGSFTESLFTQLIGSGPANPDFSGGTQTYFGFSGGNSLSGTLTQYYDNFLLESAALPAAVPEPSTLLLLGTGLGGLFAWRVKRRSRRGTRLGSTIDSAAD